MQPLYSLQLDNTISISPPAPLPPSAPPLPQAVFYPGVLALYGELDRCFAAKHAPHLRRLRAAFPQQYPTAAQAAAGVPASPARGVPPRSPGRRGPSPSPLRQASSSAASVTSGPMGSPFAQEASVALGAAAPGATPGSAPGSGAGVARAASPSSCLEAALHQDPGTRRLHQEGSNLVFLSARPESYKGLTESEAYKRYFQPLVARGDLDTSPTMLLGSLHSGYQALWQHLRYRVGWAQGLAASIGGAAQPPPPPPPRLSTPDPGREEGTACRATAGYSGCCRPRSEGGGCVLEQPTLADCCAVLPAPPAPSSTCAADESVPRVCRHYPEAAFVLVGDNGQGDVLAAEILWTGCARGWGPPACWAASCSRSSPSRPPAPCCSGQPLLACMRGWVQCSAVQHALV